MSKRLELHNILIGLLGSPNVYFQPPSTVKMQYPCIVYKRSQIKTTYANNSPYANKTRYQVTVIDANPDSVTPGKIGTLPLSSFAQHFTADNLNHDIYNIYY